MRWLGLLLLLAGCNPVATMPDQAAATTIVCNKQYGMTIAPPQIEWVTGADLNCGENKGGWLSYAFSPPECVAGLSSWETFDAAVAWPPAAKFSTTAFAHELCHLRDGVVTNGQDLDPNHTGECFVAGGLVALANQALAEAGL